MNLQCVIFDFDGTLFDSMYVWKDVGIRYLKHQNITPRQDFQQTVSSMTLYQAAQYVSCCYPIGQSAEQIMDGVNRLVEDEYVHHVLPAAGVEHLLGKLAEKQVKMVIATLSERHHVAAALKRCHLDHYFTDIITARQVPTGKHSPKIYFAAMQACGAQKENTIVVEDSFSAARTAHNAGFTVIGVYEKSEPEQKQMMEICDLYVKDLTQWKVEEFI